MKVDDVYSAFLLGFSTTNGRVHFMVLTDFDFLYHATDIPLHALVLGRQ